MGWCLLQMPVHDEKSAQALDVWLGELDMPFTNMRPTPEMIASEGESFMALLNSQAG